MKSIEIICEIKKCIKQIDSSNFEMSAIADSLLVIREHLNWLCREDLGNKAKSVSCILRSGRYCRRSIVSRLESIIHNLGKIKESSTMKSKERRRKTSRLHYSARTAREQDSFDLWFETTRT